MKSFKSEDSFHITGRGQVFCMRAVAGEDTPEIGEEVEIDGKTYTVRGIESFYKMIPGATNICILTAPLGKLVDP